MKVVQLLGKAWPETTVLFSSMAYLVIRILADVNKIFTVSKEEAEDIKEILEEINFRYNDFEEFLD